MAPKIDQISVTYSWPGVLAAFVTFFVIHRVYWEFTIGATRRRLVRDNGCQPVARYPHKGLSGYLFGWDTLMENLSNFKDGHFNEGLRLRNFKDHNTIQLRNFNRNFIHTIEPENVKTVLSTKFSDFGLGKLRGKTLEPVFGHGIFASDGKAWENSRALIRPSFTKQQVGDLSSYEDHVQHMITHIPRNGETVDLQDLFFKLTMDSATEFLFGKSTHTLVKGQEDPDSDRFADAFTYVLERMARDFRTARLSRFISDPKRQDDSEFIRGFADRIIKEAIIEQEKIDAGMEVPKRKYTFIYELLKLTRDPYVLRAETMNVLLAGRDTTASLLSHVFYELARRPDIWAKLQAEINELGGEAPTYETLKNMKYVKWVLNESLRLKPVVPSNSRIALRDTVLPIGGGPDEKSPVLVTKGTAVTYGVWSMQRRKDLFGPDAEEFKPERWEKLRPGWEYLPFNGGPRICIGQNFALTEAAYVLIRLLQHFERIEPRDDTPWRELMTLTLAIRNGVQVGMYWRNQE